MEQRAEMRRYALGTDDRDKEHECRNNANKDALDRRVVWYNALSGERRLQVITASYERIINLHAG